MRRHTEQVNAKAASTKREFCLDAGAVLAPACRGAQLQATFVLMVTVALRRPSRPRLRIAHGPANLCDLVHTQEPLEDTRRDQTGK